MVLIAYHNHLPFCEYHVHYHLDLEVLGVSRLSTDSLQVMAMERQLEALNLVNPSNSLPETQMYLQVQLGPLIALLFSQQHAPVLSALCSVLRVLLLTRFDHQDTYSICKGICLLGEARLVDAAN